MRMMRGSRIGTKTLTAVLGLLATAATAQATTLYVTAYGADSGTCGAVTSPCRSITQAIANASGGESISVGPGLYGDVNADGSLGGPGEEPSAVCTSGTCMVKVNKYVKLSSTDGATATIIQAPSALNLDSVIELQTAAELGKANKGFTISGGAVQQVYLDYPDTGAKVVGNRLVASAAASGLVGYALSDVLIRQNVALCTTYPVASGVGFRVLGDGIQIIGNAASGFVEGFQVGDGTNWTMTGNVANGNFEGISILIDEEPPVKFDRNSAVANDLDGISFYSSDIPPGGMTLNLSRGNIFGNGENGLSPNCGLTVTNPSATAPVTINLDGYFWGAALGPGANPADAVGGACNTTAGGGVTINMTNPAPKPNTIKVSPQR